MFITINQLFIISFMKIIFYMFKVMLYFNSNSILHLITINLFFIYNKIDNRFTKVNDFTNKMI